MSKLQEVVKALMKERGVRDYAEVAERHRELPGVTNSPDAATIARAVEEPARWMRPLVWAALLDILGEEQRMPLWEAFEADLEAEASVR